MIVTCVHVKVKPEHIDDFIAASKPNHLGSVQEAGNVRFDICQSADDPSSFLLYEAYESEEAAAAHKQTDHYLAWRQTVADWMARPREGVRYNVLLPES
ncbi:MAG: antibiotic biosynthesis monooxygenase [Phycisphaeraceae bacterium]|nr:antibiotic biosynthesis monooxygenase [Phycisphaeraceae bacterium]